MAKKNPSQSDLFKIGLELMPDGSYTQKIKTEVEKEYANKKEVLNSKFNDLVIFGETKDGCLVVVNEDYITVNIKPLSQNDAWRGRRFKSKLYIEYEKRLLKILPDYKIEPKKQYRVFYEFGFSNMASDFDNPIKSLTDILQKKYGFDDRYIMEAHIIKKIVKKGQEYFTVKFTIIN